MTGPPLDSSALRTETGEPSTATDQQIAWLVETYGDLLYRVAVSIVRSRQLAEEVVQEVLVKAWTSMPSWEDDVPVRWARTVTKNAALSVIRSAEVRHTVALTPAVELRAEAPGGVEDEIVRQESTAAMWDALGSLDEDARLLLVLHEVDDLSYEEIAVTTGSTVSAVKSKIYRARIALHREMDQ